MNISNSFWFHGYLEQIDCKSIIEMLMYKLCKGNAAKWRYCASDTCQESQNRKSYPPGLS